jgi:CheY-like chemotaxis protein
MSTASNEFAYRKVMVIDDSYIDRYIAQTMIAKEKFAREVIPMESGPDALEFLQTAYENNAELPGLVFLDINMPEMNGFEFLEEYAALPEPIRHTCTIIMLTSSLNPLDKERAEQNVYVQQFVNKPLNRESLRTLKCIESIIKPGLEESHRAEEEV